MFNDLSTFLTKSEDSTASSNSSVGSSPTSDKKIVFPDSLNTSADSIEFKPKSNLSASLNATSFVPFKPAGKVDMTDTTTLELNNDFTPSTPYVHKFRTEICKNFELYGKCKYGDECSFAHGRTRMMIKSDVSVLYKTKLCKKYSANGYCPYGMRC